VDSGSSLHAWQAASNCSGTGALISSQLELSARAEQLLSDSLLARGKAV